MNLILKWYLRVVLSRPFLRSVDWTAEERTTFDLFCRERAGQKLFEFLRQLVANATFNAVYQNSVTANAHARGMQEMLAVLHKLRVFPEQEESSVNRSLEDSVAPTGSAGVADGWRGFLGGQGAID